MVCAVSPKDNDDNDDDAYPRLIGVILLRLSPEVLGLCYDVCEGAKRSPATENLFSDCRCRCGLQV